MYFSYCHTIDVVADRDEIRISDIVNDHQNPFRFIDLLINDILRFKGQGHYFPFHTIFHFSRYCFNRGSAGDKS
jgi:hypothetical protein